MITDALALLEIFCRRLESIYGLYQETSVSFKSFSQTLQAQVNNPKTATSRESKLAYGFGDPNTPDARFAHSSEIGEIIDRCGWGGSNQIEMGRLVVVMAYSVWEHEVRPKLARTLEIPVTKVAHPVFGDLRLYRQAILHVGGRLDKPAETLDFVQRGDEVRLSYDDLRLLFSRLIDAVQDLAVTWCGQKVEYRFAKPPEDLR